MPTHSSAGGVAFTNVNVAMNVLADAALQCVCRPHEVEVEEVGEAHVQLYMEQGGGGEGDALCS